MDAEAVGNIHLHPVKLQSAPLEVLSEGFGLFCRGLSAFPPFRIGAT